MWPVISTIISKLKDSQGILSYVHCKSNNISEMAKDRDITANHL